VLRHGPEQLPHPGRLRVVLADGACSTPRTQPASPFPRQPCPLGELARWAPPPAPTRTLAARIRHKYKIKNTTGYSLNALIDYEDPIDILPT
jgi:D-lactate dehydrogenase